MAPRKPKQIEGQLSFESRMDFSPVIVGGLAVDVTTRANYLKSAAINQGKANQRIGFGDAVEIEPHSGEIWRRYKGTTRKRVARALDNVSGFENQAKKDFWIATGLGGVVSAKELDIGKDEAQALARVWYRDFKARMKGGQKPGDAKKAKAKFIGNLNRQVTAQKRLKSSPAKEQQAA